MSDDWREQARKLREELDRPEKEKMAKLLAKEKEKDKKERERLVREIEEWAKRKGFVCSVCGATAKDPAKGKYVEETDYRGYYELDWNSPGDLSKCGKCQNWGCKDCIEAGICRNCAEKYG